MNRKINIIFLLIFSLFINGCSMMNIGESQGYCEVRGCDYADAGQCGDVYDIFQSRYENIEDSYKNVKCNCDKKVNYE